MDSEQWVVKKGLSLLQVGDTLTLGFGYPGVLHASDIPSVSLEGAAAEGYTSQLPSSS